MLAIKLKSGSPISLQADGVILEEGSAIVIPLDLKSGSHLLTESLLRFVA